MTDERRPVLRILGGLHAGADCPIPSRPFSVGSEPPADVILHDEGVAPIHFVLDVDGEDVRIASRAAGVAVEGTPLDTDEIVIAAMPLDIAVGSLSMRCEPGERARVDDTVEPAFSPRDPVRFRLGLPRQMRSPYWAIPASLALLIVPLVAFRAASSDNPKPRSAPASSLLSRSMAEAPHPDEAELPITQIGDARLRRETEGRLRALDLSGIALDVSAGIVIANGNVEPDALSRLHQVEVWFDHRFGDHAVFISQVVAAKPPPLSLALDAVWAGPEPNIVVHGQKYYVGAALPGGAVVERITDRQIFLRQGGRQYEADY